MAVRVNGTATVPASLQTDISTIRTNVATILTRVTGAVALDADMQVLLARLTAARAGYLDNINQAGLLQVTATRAGYLDNLSAGAVALQASLLVVPKESTSEQTGGFSFAAGTSDTFSAWLELISSASAGVNTFSVQGGMNMVGPPDVRLMTIEIGTGAGGAEVTRDGWSGNVTAVSDIQSYVIAMMRRFPSGTRFAIRSKVSSSQTATTSGYYCAAEGN